MAHLLRPLVLALALSLSLSLAAAADRVSETCKHSGQLYQLCVDALSSDVSSRTADAHDLAKIALKLASKNATAAATLVSVLLEKPSDEPNLQACLTDCFDEYVDAVDQLIDAQPALDDRDYVEVGKWVEAAHAAVTACQNGCKGARQIPNPLAKNNNDVANLCSIAFSIVKFLQAKH